MSSLIKLIESETDIAKLWEMLHEKLTFTVETVREMAAIVRRLEELGCDTGELRTKLNSGILKMIRRVAFNQMMPEVFVEFLGTPRLQEKIAALPLPDQKRMVEGKPIKVIVSAEDHRMVAPFDMTKDDVKQVFGPDGIRNDREQIAYLADESRKASIRSKATNNDEISVDKKKKTLIVNGVEISLRQLMRYVSEIAG